MFLSFKIKTKLQSYKNMHLWPDRNRTIGSTRLEFMERMPLIPKPRIQEQYAHAVVMTI